MSPLPKRFGTEKPWQNWREIGGKRHYFRSLWDYRYALYLELLKATGKITDWQYEPTTFWFEGIKRGTNNYKPDFKVIHLKGNEEYVEVKGYQTPTDLTKWKRMAKYHPDVKLRIIKGDFFKANNKALKSLITEWE